MSRYLLDTNIVSDLVRRPQGVVAQRIGLVGVDAVVVSVISSAELLFGAERRGAARLYAQIKEVLHALRVEPIEAPVDVVYAQLRTTIESGGVRLEPLDLLIAAHAVSLGCVLVSDDRAFAHVRDLRLENWLA